MIHGQIDGLLDAGVAAHEESEARVRRLDHRNAHLADKTFDFSEFVPTGRMTHVLEYVSDDLEVFGPVNHVVDDGPAIGHRRPLADFLDRSGRRVEPVPVVLARDARFDADRVVVVLAVEAAQIQMDRGAGLAVQFQQPGDLLGIGSIRLAGDELASAVSRVPVGEIGQHGDLVGNLAAVHGQESFSRRHFCHCRLPLLMGSIV
jgi:hypothetical protein